MNVLDYIRTYAQVKRSFIEKLIEEPGTDVPRLSALASAYQDIIEEIQRVESVLPLPGLGKVGAPAIEHVGNG